MIKRLLTLSLAALLLVSTIVTAMPASVYAAPGDKPDKEKDAPVVIVPGNNGTLKIHEEGTPSGTEPVPGTENTDPKVCVFNFEGFGFDAGQEGYVEIKTQGGGPNAVAVKTVEFGPATATGYDETEYISGLPEDLYKATLYGKNAGGINYEDEKAKSKNFKVDCEEPVVEEATAFVTVIPATCFVGQKLSYDVSLWTNAKLDANNSDSIGLEGPDNYTVVAVADDDAEFVSGAGVISQDKKTQTFSGTLTGKLTGRQCAPTANPCVAKQSLLVTNENEQGFSYAGTRVDGRYEYVDGALRLTTLNPISSSSTNKVHGVRAVNIPMAQYGGDFNVDFTASSIENILPGINVYVDVNGDGISDVTLVAEPEVAGYHTFWTNVPGFLPANAGGQGGAYSGDQTDILALYPNAVVVAEAFSLGSGVGTDGDLFSWSTPCNTYTYDRETLTATASVSVTEGDCEAPGKLTYDVTKWTNSALGQGSTLSGTTGPAPYSVVAIADKYAQFTGGATTQTFSGTLEAQTPLEDCVLGEELPGTPVVTPPASTPQVLPATSSASLNSLILQITGFVAFVGIGAFLIRNKFARSL